MVEVNFVTRVAWNRWSGDIANVTQGLYIGRYFMVSLETMGTC